MDGARVRYVFLDRDGVINRKMPEGAWVTDWTQFAWLPGAVEAVVRMHEAGLKLCLVTNQRGIALGLYTTGQLEQIHHNLQAHLAQHGAALDGIYYCPHNRGECDCRKPGPGLFAQAFHDFPLANPHNSVMIGDSLSDIQAGKRLGMQTIFIQAGLEEQRAGAGEAAALADAVAGSLLEAVADHLR